MPSRLIVSLLTFALVVASAAAATYEVGPSAGQLSHLADVPWRTLLPGDVVNIHTRPGGYHEIIQISASGTAAQPILIRGIPDPVTGALPIIDGSSAVMDPHVDFRNPVFENLGVIIVTTRATGYVYGQTFPSWITIESLDIRNALYDPSGVNHFTDQHGATRIYDSFGCGIYIEFAQHLIIRGCEISFNGNGIFANSKNAAAQASRDLLIEKNYLHDNGQPVIPGLSNAYHEHNIYVESVGAVYQFNRFGPLRAGCHGCMIKDRSSGTVIRYNEVISTETSDMFCILDPQGGAGYIDQQPDYRDAFVYGNVITLQDPGTSWTGSDIVCFAAFNGTSSYQTQHRGTLYFYQNTVVVHQAGVGAFFLTDPAYTGTPTIYEKVDARNNIFYTDSVLQANVYQAFHFAVASAITTMDFGQNWVSPGTLANWTNHSVGTVFNGWSNLIVGDTAGHNTPGFTNAAALNYRLIAGTNSLDRAGPLAPAALALGYTVNFEYVSPASSSARFSDAISDLGAFETPSTSTPPPGPPPVTPPSGPSTPPPATPTPAPPPSRLVNLSTRSSVGLGDNVLIAGFVISGSTPKQVVIRAPGPALIPLGVADALVDPTLEVFNASGTKILENDNWSNALAADFAVVGAGAWPAGSKDAAVVATLAPGAYSAIVRGKNSTTGVSLVEVFEEDPTHSGAKLVNLSSRSLVKTGDEIMIAGFVIVGTQPQTVIIRAAGPSLVSAGISNALTDPVLEIYDSKSAKIYENDDWSAALAPEFQIVGAGSWPVGSKDAALLVTLAPGAYTAVVKGKLGASGVALVEVFAK